MKTFLGITLTALVLLAPAMSEAGNLEPTTTEPGTTVVYPARAPYAPSYSVPSYYASGYGSEQPYALDQQNGMHVTPASPLSENPVVVTQPLDSTLGLVNRTGDGP